MTQFRLFFPKETSDLDSIGFALKVVKVAAYTIVGDAPEVGRDTQTPARTRKSLNNVTGTTGVVSGCQQMIRRGHWVLTGETS